jgi:hypothetical protein
MAKANHSVSPSSLLGMFANSLGKTAADKYAYLLSAIGAIIALDLIKYVPAKNMGACGDFAKVAGILRDTERAPYTDYAGCLSEKAIRRAIEEVGGGFRSILEWSEACTAGETIVAQLTAGAREKAAAKAKKAQATKKANEVKASGDVATLTGTMVAEMIESGQFDSAGLAAIRAALDKVATAPATAPAPAVPA